MITSQMDYCNVIMGLCLKITWKLQLLQIWNGVQITERMLVSISAQLGYFSRAVVFQVPYIKLSLLEGQRKQDINFLK